MKTTAVEIPTKPGTAFDGGIYIGRYFIGADAYALIVSPKATGEIAPTPWNKSLKTVAGALSYNDGLANTGAMAKAGSALAKQVRALDIDGHKDWFLPSRLEALILFGETRELKAFKPGGTEALQEAWYWTSTQGASYADYAWIQSFSHGNQDGIHKDNDYRARAVRRLKI